jgi:hypothetical protein
MALNAAQRQPGAIEELLLAQTVLADVQHAPRRPHGAMLRSPVDALRGNVFELEREHVHAAREVAHGGFVVVTRGDFAIRKLAGRRVVIGRKRMHAIPHPPRAMANMRPSCPPPMTPMCCRVGRCGRGHGGEVFSVQYSVSRSARILNTEH